MTAADLQEQLELAYDIEDWDKVHTLSQRLRVIAPNTGRDGTLPLTTSDGRNSRQRSRSARRSSQRGSNPVVIEYNKTIKAYLHRRDLAAAHGVLAVMRELGARPTNVTHNEFLNFHVKAGDLRSALRVVTEEMHKDGLQPNSVSASIISKGLSEKTPTHELEESVGIVCNASSSSAGIVDEILLSSVAETVVRTGSRAPKLFCLLHDMLSKSEGVIANAQTFGSVIRAYGHAKDTKSMCRQWETMISQGTRPTVITTGIMMEQLAINGQVHTAYGLVQDLHRRGYSDSVNAVVYSSLIKGFCIEKSHENVWRVYREMRLCGVRFTIKTYNALVGAFAECGMIDRAVALFAEMRAECIFPTVCTWTRLAKGHCLGGDVEAAVCVMEQMRATRLRPDEVFYNSLLDGCAQYGLVDLGLNLLQRMELDEVAASNYTISILVKLMGHASKLDKCFSWLERLHRKYHVKISSNVCKNLFKICCSHGEAAWAVKLLRLVGNVGSVRPDRELYGALLKECVSQGSPRKAAAAVRLALDVVEDNQRLSDFIDPCLLRDVLSSRTKVDGMEAMAPIVHELRCRDMAGSLKLDL